MAHNYLQLFIRSSSAEKHDLIGKFLQETSGKARASKITKLLSEINPDLDRKHWGKFKSCCSDYFEEDTTHNLGNGLKSHSGYWTFEITCGSLYEEEAAVLLNFFGSLDTSVDCRGLNTYTGDVVETFLRYVNGKVYFGEHVPFESLKEDDAAVTTGVYADWHRGLLDLRVGYLAVDLDHKNIFVLGSPGKETTSILEHASIKDMTVQDSITEETDLVIVCGDAMKEDIETAETSVTPVCTENILAWSYPLLETQFDKNRLKIDRDWELRYNASVELEEEPVSSFGIKIIGKVFKTHRTESGLVIKDTGNCWPEIYHTDEAILDDMSQVRYGDVVTMITKSLKKNENKVSSRLHCTFINRIPTNNSSKNLSMGRLISGKIYQSNRTSSGLILKDTNHSWPTTYLDYIVILDDMSLVQCGDEVIAVSDKYDKESMTLICTLIGRKPGDKQILNR